MSNASTPQHAQPTLDSGKYGCVYVSFIIVVSFVIYQLSNLVGPNDKPDAFEELSSRAIK